MSRTEKWALGILTMGFLLGFLGLSRQFYFANTVVVPSGGGTYIEGSVGELQPMNPWFTVQNDVNRDIVSLVFAGLLRYNPQTKEIEEDLATLKISDDQKTYTLTLRPDLLWHDTTEKEPHPVTADDVVFTFRTIQDPDFPNLLMQQNFRGVSIVKVDDRTVQFKLDAPYSFFPSNLTIGLIPERSFEGIPVSKFDQHLDFGFNPVGAGPYKVKSIVQTDLSSEITLERFIRPSMPIYRLDRVVFRVFSDYSSLLSDLRNLQGVRLVPRNKDATPLIPKQFQTRNYYLPQYVALFFNLDRPALQDKNLRLGLQLGTNKQAIVDGIGESIIVDTPLLQIDVSDWHYQFDINSAQGALLASKWNIPERLRLQKLLERDEMNKAGVLKFPSLIQAQGNQPLVFSGAYIEGMPRGSVVNGNPLRDGPSGTGSWVLSLPVLKGTGALKIGENILKLTGPDGKVLDSASFFLADTPQLFARAQSERDLMDRYVRTRDNAASVPAAQRIVITQLIVENGMLRLRQNGDPPSVRRNEKGEQLTLRLLTSRGPATYKLVAEEIKQEWAQLGVQVNIEIPATDEEFTNRLLKRDYDILLFGQSLLDNLDSYPYWHSSGVQQTGGEENDLRRDAYNLSQFKSFAADSLLETIRRNESGSGRQLALKSLRSVLTDEVPAVFLYSPLYTYASRGSVRGIELGSLSVHSDRFLTLYKWYVREDRVFRPGKSWWSFPGWTLGLLTGKNSAAQ